MNKLNFEWKTRKDSENRTEREFLDFFIDDVPLSEKFSDYVSGIGCFLPNESERAIKRLLLEEEADLSNNRRSLYVCPECGELSCGAVSIFIERLENKVIWKEFAMQYDNSEELSEYEWIEPFIFDWQQYKEKLTNLLLRLETNAS